MAISRLQVAGWSLLGLGLVLGAGCSSDTDVPPGGGGADATVGPAGPGGGGPGGGGAGAAGGSGAAGGAGGEGGAGCQCGDGLVCDPRTSECVECLGDEHCEGSTPACDLATQICVGCLDDGYCSAPTPACDTAAQLCVACLDESDCAAPTPACDTTAQLCVECLDDGNCAAPTPACDTAAQVCVTCLDDGHCAAPTPACDTTADLCVECLGDQHCGGATPACDTAAQLCVECLNNTHCGGSTPVCDTAAEVCVGCLGDNDCGGATPFCNTTLSVCTACQMGSSCSYLMMPDSASANNRLVLFSPVDGALINGDYFPLAGGTPIRAVQVGSEIWISEQIGDRLSRWGITGGFLGAVADPAQGGGLDNNRGMELIGNLIYVANAGSQNGAPGAAVVVFDQNGALVTSFPTAGLAPAPFDVLEYPGGELLVGSSSANDDVHRFTLAGTSVGTFHNSTSLNFAQQVSYASNGDVLVGAFSSNTVVRLDATTGALLSSFPASGARGVYQLQNGNILWTNSAGAHVYDVTTSTSSQVYTGQGRHIGVLTIP